MSVAEARRFCAVAGGALSAAVLAAALGHAQTLKIPDFRQGAPAVAPAPRAGEACDQCGVIRSIRETQATRPVNVPKAFQTEQMPQGPASPNYVGAVIALPMGDGSGKPYVGGVGTPEMRERFTETTYEITVRLDTGAYTAVQRNDGASYRVGDRVRVQGTQLTLLTQ